MDANEFASIADVGIKLVGLIIDASPIVHRTLISGLVRKLGPDAVRGYVDYAAAGLALADERADEAFGPRDATTPIPRRPGT